MKLTIFVGEFNKSLNANTRIALSVVDELVKQGLECECLAINFHNDNYYEEALNNHVLKVFPANRDNSCFRLKKDESGLGLIKYIIKHPIEGINFLLNKNKDYKEIVSYINNNDSDCIISIIMPFKATKQIILNNKNKKSIVYQMDPWGLNEFLYRNSKIKKIYDELKVFNKSDFIYTTDLLYNEYSNNHLYKKYISKMDIANFVNIYKKKETKCDSIQFDKNYYNIVYLGILDDLYRDPTNILNFILNIKKECNLPIKIHFIGNINSNNLLNIQNNNEDTIKTYNPIDAFQANYLMNQNVFLLNINNSFSNQSPSKLIDYISTGNPIINVISNSEDISNEILEKYDSKYNFYNYLPNDEEKFVEYIKDKHNKKIDFEKISKDYYEYTPEYLADKIIKKIKELTK